jgi:FkbM family methyltransferase
MIRRRVCKRGIFSFYTNDLYVGRALNLTGEYGEDELTFMSQFVRLDRACVQAGANIGLFPIFLSRMCPRVFTAEPQIPLFELLITNIRDNKITNIEAFPGAFGSQAGTIECPMMDYVGEGDFCGVGLGGEPRPKSYPMDVTTIDSFVKGVRVGLIQLDVEGMEIEALRGAKDTIERDHPTILIENNYKESPQREALRDFMHERGYRFELATEGNLLATPKEVALCPE